MKIQCESWLKPSDVKNVHLHQIDIRLPGTCDWITSNDIFKNWLQSGCSPIHDRLLVISGTHGCGKTVLASSIVTGLTKDTQYSLFFAFSSSDGSRQTSDNLIRTILYQLLHETSSQEAVDIVHQLRLKGQPTTSELWEVFIRMTSSLTKPVYCTVDGIDECSDFNHSMCLKIMHILRLCPNLRIVLLGRPHVVRANAEHLDSLAIDLTSALLSRDIESFLENEIAQSALLSLPELRKTIFTTLKDRSDGMFLWVRLMVDDLKRSSSRSELKVRLESLPCGLEEAYHTAFLRLSQKLDNFEIRLVQSVLAFMTISYCPLHFDEIKYALALHWRSLEKVAQPLEEYLCLQLPQRVVDLIGGLVFSSNNALRLIHSSVRDFLVRPEDQWVRTSDPAVLRFRVDVIQTHRSFAWLCLDYMRREEEKNDYTKLEVSQSTESLREHHPLLHYATSYIFFHLN